MPSRDWVRGAAGLWLVAVVLTGCGGGPAAIPTQPIESYQFQQTVDDVRAALVPVLTAAKAQAGFRGGEELLANGIVPVQVIIENGSQYGVRVAPGTFRLVGQRNNGYALSAADAFGMVRRRVGLWGVLGPIGGVIPGLQDKGLQDDLEARALKESTIAVGESQTGFVYFMLQVGETDLAGSQVLFTLQDYDGRERAFDIPIAGRTDVASPSVTSTQPSAPTAPAPPAPTPSREPTVIHGAGGGVIIHSPSP
ncbi:MAG TPA: hypothetical protein VLG48_12160 [Candidatus Methylomirabilis sp.]|nr:hypothetical protein [Candidatus Methylomirabilis sp.]